MFKNYIKVAYRNLKQHKSYTIINVIGLAVGMACCILIALYAREELSYDRFHKKADRIVSVGIEAGYFGRMLNTPHPLASAMEEEMPAVERAVRLLSASNLELSIDGRNFVKVKEGQYTEPVFFDMFSFNVVKGNGAQALANPKTIVLTESAAAKLFSEGQNPIGQTVHWKRGETEQMLTVRGIVSDPPSNSSIRFGALISYVTLPQERRKPDGWRMYMMDTYGLLRPGVDKQDVSSQFKELAKAHYDVEDGESGPSFFSVPLTQMHLSDESNSSGFSGDKTYLYLFSSIALFILVIACVNYINLATARTSLRTREVGVRKTLGGQREQIIGQFLGESVLLAFVSYLLGLSISQLVLPYFNSLFGTHIVWHTNGLFLVWLLLAAIAVGILAGIYPALYLSGFTPFRVIRGQQLQGQSRGWLRKTLVVGQFALAVMLIISALVIYKQLNYTQTKDLGFVDEQVVVVDFPTEKSWELRNKILRDASSFPGIKEVSAASCTPGNFGIRLGHKPKRLSSEHAASSDESITFAPAVVDSNFIELLDIKLLAGRNFKPALSSDRNSTYILNEKAVKKLGWTPQEAIGKPFNMHKEGKVIGVVENFHIASLKREVEPVSLQMFKSSSWSSGRYLLARLSPNEITPALEFIEKELSRYSASDTFEYFFLDEVFDSMYRTEQRLSKIIILFTFVAIVIACLGLYGLSAFAAEQRTKEIGIRKVMGGSVFSIVMLLSKDFLKLVALGFIIAAPLTWYGMSQWLQSFAYQTEIGVGVFIIAGITAVTIALVTVSWQSFRAALSNPVNSIQVE